MSTTVTTQKANGTPPAPAGDIMESVLIKGDLSKLTPQERSTYYLKVCESAGLNPLTKPFEYITLNSKLTLYALRACTDQLRTIHKVSVEELNETERDGVFIVTAKVRNVEGRTDMAKGAVTITNLKGDALANAMMKAETKAKRRATLSLCGLGFLDETEIETFPGARRPPIAASPLHADALHHDPETGEIHDDIPGFLDRSPKKTGSQTLTVPQSGDANDWISFGQQYIEAVKGSASLAEANEWHDHNQSALDQMKQEAPKVHARMTNAVAKARAGLATESDMLGPADGEVLVG